MALVFACLLCCVSLKADSSFSSLAERAERARSARDFDAAETNYRAALALAPEWAEGWWALGTIHYERDQFSAAKDSFARAAQLAPQAGSAAGFLGLSQMQLGETPAALENIRKARKLGVPDRQLRHVLMSSEALLQMSVGEFETAQQTLGALSRESAGSEEGLLALGGAALRVRPAKFPPPGSAAYALVLKVGSAERSAARRDYQQASAEYARLGAGAEAVPGLQYAWGRYLLQIDEDEKALLAFERESRNSPGHVLARLAIADSKLALDPEGGLIYAREAVNLNPDVPLGHYVLGTLLLKTGQSAAAIEELEVASRRVAHLFFPGACLRDRRTKRTCGSRTF